MKEGPLGGDSGGVLHLPAGRYLGSAMTSVCPECGAPLTGGRVACQEYFQALLALESRIHGGPGQVAHYLAVTSYNLQHPAAFTTDARTDMLAGLAGDLSVDELRERTRRTYDGPKRVLQQRGIGPGDPGNAPVEGWPTEWGHTVLHALASEPERSAYFARVEEWASSVLETIRSRSSTNPSGSAHSISP